MNRVPNILSSLRILLAPLFVALYVQDNFWWSATGLAIYIFAAITDYLDGYYARRYKASSRMGAFLDPLADKVLTFAGFICLPLMDPGQFPWWMIGVILFRDLLVTWLRVWSEQQGNMLQTRKSAKYKTLIQMVFLYIVLVTGVAAKAGGSLGQAGQQILETGILGWLFVFVLIITVYTALEYLATNRRLFLREP